MQELEAHLAQPSVTDWAVLMVGYLVLGCLALAGESSSRPADVDQDLCIV